MSLKPSDIFKRIDTKFYKIANIVGVYQDDRSAFNYKIIFGICIMMNAAIVTISSFFNINGTFEEICQLVVLLNLGLQLMVRGVNRVIIKDHLINIEIRQKLTAFYGRFELEYSDILSAHIKRLEKVMDLMTKGYFCFFHLPVLTSWIILITTGKHTSIGPVSYPFLTIDTLTGFLIIHTIVTLSATVFWLSLFSLIFQIVFYGFEAIPMSDVLIQHLRKFGTELAEKKKKNGQPQKLADIIVVQEEEEEEEEEEKTNRERLVEIIKLFTEYNEYIGDLINFMSFPGFIAIAVNSISMGLGIIHIFTYSMPVGIGLLMIYFMDAAIPCIIGNIITTQKERLIDEVCAFPWYELENSEKKIFLQFLHFCQYLEELEVPIFDVLNLEVLKDIINGTYSFFMFINNFVKL